MKKIGYTRSVPSGGKIARQERKIVNTRYKILLCAAKLFLEKGYKDTYVTTITNMLKISTGNLTFHFPTKEHILAELVKELNLFQQQIAVSNDHTEVSLPGAYLLELVMFASICEENPNIRDLMVAAYTYPLSLEMVRANDTQRAKSVFGEFCPEWTETDFIQAENVVSGIEYAMYRTENTQQISFEQRVTSSIDAIMKVYEVPENIRQNIIAEVMSADYRGKGGRIFEEFADYIEDIFAED